MSINESALELLQYLTGYRTWNRVHSFQFDTNDYVIYECRAASGRYDFVTIVYQILGMQVIHRSDIIHVSNRRFINGDGI